MGQNLEAMNKPRPRAELLYELVSTGNIVAIKALCEEGVSLEVNLTVLLILSTLKKKKKNYLDLQIYILFFIFYMFGTS